MADAGTAQTPGPATAPATGSFDPMDVFRRIEKEKAADRASADTHLEAAQAAMAKMQDAAPKPEPTPPEQQWGGMAMAIAALGGLLTHHPIATAANSMAGVLNAYKQGDAAAAKQQFEEWKTAHDAAVKMVDLEIHSYEAAMKRAATKPDEARSMLIAQTAAYRQDYANELLRNGDLDGAMSVLAGYRKAAKGYKAAGDDFSTGHDQRMKMSDAIYSDDPVKQADGLDMLKDKLEKDASGKGSTAANRMQATTVGVRIGAVIQKLRSGDPVKIAEAQAEAAQIEAIGPGVLKAPAAAKPGSSQATKWEVRTDADGTQYLSRVGPDGKPQNQSLTGEPYTPKAALQVGKEDAPGVAVRKEEDLKLKGEADAERQRHDLAIEAITTDHNTTITERDQRLATERERHDRVVEENEGGAPMVAYRRFLKDNPNASTQEVQKFFAGMKGTKLGPPLIAETKDATGNPVYTLAQQTPEGQWVTADENRTPIGKPVNVYKTDEAPVTNDPTVKFTGKSIAEYRQPLLAGWVLKTPWGHAVLAEVRKQNQDYAVERFSSISKAMKDFSTGVQGNQIRYINVAVNHLGTLANLATALNNGEVRALNSIYQQIGEELGVPAPTSFDAAKQLIGQEITKAVVAGGGGVTERQAAGEQLIRSRSPEQITGENGVIDTYRALLGGQMSGLKGQFQQSIGMWVPPSVANFDTYVSPTTVKFLNMAQASGNASPKPDGMSDSQILAAAKAAITGGKSRDAVLKQLRAWKIDPAGL